MSEAATWTMPGESEPAYLERAEKRAESLAQAFGTPVNANPPGLVASFLAFAPSGTLLGLTVYNSNAATRYVQIFDAGALPADGTVPRLVWQLPTLNTLTVSFDPVGRWFQRGCWIVNSTTDTTKTLSGADLLIDVQYV